MCKCPFKPETIQGLFEFSYLLHLCSYNLEVENCGKHVLAFGGNHKTGVLIFVKFQRYLSFSFGCHLEFGERTNGNHFFRNPHVSKI